MAKRELSSTLRNLKFMQRATAREEPSKKDEEEVKPEGNFSFPASVYNKCVVIMEGDPHPRAIKGRMSFRSFNPAIDKLNQEAANIDQPSTSTLLSGHQAAKSSSRENGSGKDEGELSEDDEKTFKANGDLKKQFEEDSETFYPNKSPKTSYADQGKGSSEKRKSGKLDWNVLRPSKTQKKRG